MNETELWIYMGSREPESIRALLDPIRNLPPPTPAEAARTASRVYTTIDALLGSLVVQASEAESRTPEAPAPAAVSAGSAATVAAPPPRAPLHAAEEGATQRCPPVLPAHVLDAAPAPSAPLAALPPTPPPVQAPSALKVVTPPAIFTQTTDFPGGLGVHLGSLPFRAPRPDPHRTAKTAQTPVRRDQFGGTAPLDADSLGDAMKQALPFIKTPVFEPPPQVREADGRTVRRPPRRAARLSGVVAGDLRPLQGDRRRGARRAARALARAPRHRAKATRRFQPAAGPLHELDARAAPDAGAGHAHRLERSSVSDA